MSHAALPDDIETLKRLVIGRDEMIAKLMAEIARLKRWRFGRSAERLDAALTQLQLLLGDLPAPAASELPVQETVPVEDSTQSPPLQQRVTRLRRVPRALPVHLPRETIVHTPASCSCPQCGTQMRKLGEDISEMLDYIPGYLKVLRHVRPKFSCGHCAAIDRRTCAARAPSMPPRQCPHSHTTARIRYRRRPAECRESRAGALADARSCGPANSDTTPPADRDSPRVDHPAHRSTGVRFWFCPARDRAPARACHQHATSPPSAHSDRATPPRAPASAMHHPPTPR